MTNALWCDPGEHPFPQGQPGSTQIELKEQVRNQWGGTQPHGTVKDVCAACAKDYGYRGVTQDVSDEELAVQAEEIRDATGGKAKRRLLSLPGKQDRTKELEDENRDLRIEQLERELSELKGS